MDFSGVQTFDDLIMQLLGMGGANASPMGMMLRPYVQPILYKALGLQNGNQRDALLDFVAFSDKTPFGTAMELQNRRFTRIASANMQRLSNQAMHNWLADFGRTTMSYGSWVGQQKAGADTSEAAYEAFIESHATGWAGNPLWQGVYQFADPDGMMAAQRYLQQAGTNVIRRGYLTGRRGAVLQARAVGNLFLNDKGDYEYNKADYGYMDVGEASAVAAALTKDLDFFKGAGVTPDGIKNASKRLSDMLKAYTNALGPLKDVFGKDVPAMIKAVEELSGKRLTQMSAGQVHRMVRQVLDGATAGNYTLEQQVTAGAAWRGALTQMSVPFLNDLSSISVTGSILSAANMAGVAPRTMSSERWSKLSSDHITRASVSRGGAAFAQAFAVLNARDPSLTYDKFMEQYNRSYNGSIDGTLYAMTGTRNAADLERQAGESGYLPRAYKLGINKLAALDQNALQSRTRLRDSFLAQGYSSSAIDEALSYFNSTERMNNIEGINRSRMSDAAKGIANSLMSLEQYKGDMANLRILYSEREANKRAGIISRNRAISERIRRMAPADLKEAIRLYMGGASISDLKTSNKQLYTIATSDAWKTAQSAYNAARMVGSDAEAAAQYALLNGGSDDNYIEWVLKYEQATKPQDRAKAANVLTAMQYGDAAEINEYLQDGGSVGLISRAVKDFIGTKREKEFGIELSDRIKYDKMSKAIEGIQARHKLTGEQAATMNNQLVALVEREGAIDSAGIQKALTKVHNGVDEKGNVVYGDLGVSEDIVKEIMSAAGMSSKSGLEEILSDKLDLLGGLADALKGLVGPLEKIATKFTQDAVQQDLTDFFDDVE